MEEAIRLIQTASNLIADDLTDCSEADAPEHFKWLSEAAEFIEKHPNYARA